MKTSRMKGEREGGLKKARKRDGGRAVSEIRWNQSGLSNSSRDTDICNDVSNKLDNLSVT